MCAGGNNFLDARVEEAPTKGELLHLLLSGVSCYHSRSMVDTSLLYDCDIGLFSS